MKKKDVTIQTILQKALKTQRFKERSQIGKLASLWKSIFGDEFGNLVKRDGDTLYVNVKGAPLKAECENFKKWEILETLHSLSEFSAIRDIRFMET